MSRIEARIRELGYELPKPPKPVAAYVPGVLDGKLVYTSGQLPSASGFLHRGRLGETMSTEEGYAAARVCALNCLGVLKSLLGDLDRVERIVKVTGFVNSAPGYEEQPQVINGASELLGEVFGESGQHTRSAVGVAGLPLGAACEVEIIARVR